MTVCVDATRQFQCLVEANVAHSILRPPQNNGAANGNRKKARIVMPVTPIEEQRCDGCVFMRAGVYASSPEECHLHPPIISLDKWGCPRDPAWPPINLPLRFWCGQWEPWDKEERAARGLIY